jgi:hypothetical protein
MAWRVRAERMRYAVGMVFQSIVAAGLIGLSTPPDGPPPGIFPQSAAGAVSAERLKHDVQTLASFGTRHTLSDAASPTRGIGAARSWIKSELERAAAASAGRMTVAFEEFDVPAGRRIPTGGAHLVNVMAILRGVDEQAAGRRIYIVGHYDSRNGGENDAVGDAPGANDDASGTAAVLEAARALADKPLRCSVVFLATAGEEQGLYGAQYRASRAAAAHEAIVGVLNNDIVGDPAVETGGSRTDVRVFSEGIARNVGTERLAEIRAVSAESDSPSRQLARFVDETGTLCKVGLTPRLVFRPDRFLRGGDHSAFNEAGFAGVRFTSSSEVYARQHANVTEKDGKPCGDVPSFVDGEYLAGVARLNVATIVRLAMAPPTPENVRIITAELGNATTVRWSEAHDARTKGYELVWRATTEPTWTHAKDVGLVGEVTVRTSKDDHFFGVRAVSEEGYASVVGFAWQGKK